MTRRLHNLRARRLKLGASQLLVGCLAGWKPINAQPSVSFIELHEGSAAPYRVRRVRSALVWLESEPRRQREAARAEAAETARIEAVIAAPGALGRDQILRERLVDLLFAGRCEDFDILAARLDPALVEQAGTEYLDQCTPALPAEAVLPGVNHLRKTG